MKLKLKIFDIREELECSSCGKKDKSVEMLINPLLSEVYHIDEEQLLCDECFETLCNDI